LTGLPGEPNFFKRKPETFYGAKTKLWSQDKSKPLRPETELPGDSLVILPLRNIVVFPCTAVPLSFGRPASTQAIQEALRRKMAIGIIAQRDPKVDVPGTQDLYQVGTVVDVLRQVTASDGQLQLLVQGRQPF
jgi:ATP-dependent Lon protease